MHAHKSTPDTTASVPASIPWLIKLYARFLRMLPLAGGLTKLSFNRWTNALLVGVSGPAETRLLNGMRIMVYPADHDGRVLYLFGTNDPKVHHVCQALLRPGDRFFDIGANYASIGLLAAARVGPEGAVHLFEPQPNLCAVIHDAIDEARLPNVQLHALGLMREDSEMQLAKPSHHSGMATLVCGTGQDRWETQTVPVRNIATYLPPLIGHSPFGAKVDVEGAEVEILPWLLAQPGLRFVVFEAAQNRSALFEIVRQSGFALFGLKRTFFAKRVDHIDRFEKLQAYHDLVAVRLPAGVETPSSIGSYALGARIRDRG